MKKLILFLAFTFFVSSNLLKAAPWYYHNWYFGGQAMITFISESGEPYRKNFSAMTAKEGCTSISDADGKVLFYSNGQVVYNWKNQVMDNGDNLNGHSSAPQPAFAVPMPGDDARFYLFTMAADENLSAGLQYSIVDMVDNEGEGKVIEKNKVIKTNVSEAMTVTLYNDGANLCNGQGYWVICVPKTTGQIYSFRVDSNKIHNPVLSTAGTSIRAIQIKISPDRTKAAITYGNSSQDGIVSLYNFNSSTGQFSFIKSYPVENAYGVEFSPNSELLYTTAYSLGEIHQINLITDAKYIFNSSEVNQQHSLQLGPDGRIYISQAGERYLGRINDPNTFGVNAMYVPKAISIDPYACQWGLPQSIPNMPDCSNRSFFKIYVLENDLCEGNPLVLYARKYGDGQYEWTAPNGDKYTGSSVSTFALRQYKGIWKLKVTFPDGQVFNLQTTVNVVNGPKFTITGDSTLCGPDDKVTIRAKADTKLDTMYWNAVSTFIDSTSSVIFPKEAGRYVVYGRNKNGCIDSAEVNIVRYDPIFPEILGDTLICKDAETTLEAFPRGAAEEYTYEWNTGETTRDITVSDSGEYWVRVYQVGGCHDTAWFNLQYYKNFVPEFNLESPITICEGEVLQLALLNPVAGYYYEWDNGSQLTTRTVTAAGKYFLKTRTDKDCEQYDTVDVFVRPSPEAVILQGEDFVTCSGSPVELTAKEVQTDYYRWSTGEDTRTIEVNQTGRYWVAVGFANSPCIDTAFINVTFDENLDVKILGDAKICGEGSTVLTTNYNGAVFEYEWSTGETTPTITVSETGTYSVRVYTSSGCEDTGEMTVQFFEQPVAELNYSGIVEICDGESLELIPQNVKPDYNNYWTDGYQELNRPISQSGVYTFVVENDICVDTAEVQVIVNPIPEITISSSGTSLCLTPEIELTATPFNSEYTYTWSTGETGENITISEAGIYSVTVTSDKNCENQAEITIDESGDIDFYITPGSNIELCEGETVELSTSEEFASYEWSTGETTRSIVVSEAGSYTVTVFDDIGCSSSKTAEVVINNVELALDKNIIEFDEICINTNINENLQITNINENAIRIGRFEYELVNSSGGIMLMISNEEIVLQPSESHDFQLTFAPKVPSDWTGKAKIYISLPCEAVYEVNLSARSIHETAFDLPELELEAGTEDVKINLSILHNCNITNDFTANFTAKIEFDAYYFNVLNLENATLISKEYSDGKLIIEVSGIYDFTASPAQNLLALIGQSLTGRDDEATPIEIVDFEWSNPNIYHEKQPGSIYIRPFCQQEIFKINFFNPTELAVSPNPVENDIKAKIYSEETGNFSLIISNSLGESVKVINFTNESRIDEVININTSDLGSGIYNVILKAPWTIKSQQIIIVK